jgi:hypothetical protein
MGLIHTFDLFHNITVNIETQINVREEVHMIKSKGMFQILSN